MNYLATFFIFAVFVYSTVSWVIPQILAWLFKRRYKIELKVGGIVIHKFILKDVTFVKNGYKIHMEQVSFHSSLLNSEVSKLISIVIRDVRVNKDVVEAKQSKTNIGILKPLLSKQNSLVSNVIPSIAIDSSKFTKDVSKELNDLTKNILDFRDMELPRSIVIFAQFLALKLHNLSVMILRAEEGEGLSAGWLCHATAASVQLDGSGTASYLVLSGSVTEARAKLLRRTPNPNRLQTCLAEVSFGINLEVSTLVDLPFNVEKVICSINNPVAILNEGIYKFIQEKNYNVNKNQPMTHSRNFEPKDNIFSRIAPIIPKNFSFKIDGTTLTGVRENSRTDFCASLHSLQINARFSVNQIPNDDDEDNINEILSPPKLPQVYLAFQMDQLKINSNKDKLIFLNKLKLDAKLVNEVLNLYLILKMLNLSYNHDNIYEWVSTYFPQQDFDLISNNTSLSEKNDLVIPNWLKEFCDICVIQGCAELWNVSFTGLRGPNSATIACKGLKVKLDQLSDLRHVPYESRIAHLLLGMRHWSTELLIDSAWFLIGTGDIPVKKHHNWGTGFFIGVALIKWGSHGSNGTKVEAMLDCLRIEASPVIMQSLINIFECLNDYRKNKNKTNNHKINNTKTKIAININLTNVNLYTIITKNNICLMSRIDTVSVEKNGLKTSFVISGFKLTDYIMSANVCTCQRTEEMVDAFCFVKLTRIDIEPGTYSVQFLELVDIYWSPNLHLKCLETVKELKSMKNELMSSMNIKSKTFEADEKQTTSWCYTFKGDVGAHLKLSDTHDLLFTFDDISLARNTNGFCMSSNICHLAIDSAEIFTAEGVTFERIQESAKIYEERQNADNFTLDWNKIWGLTISSFRAIFPYQHNFSEAIQDEFVSLTKWLKLVHNYKKKPFTADSPLPSDIYIQVEEFILELTDDPFEVKLRDNYELLEDEYKESLKRKSMLDAKVAELCKPHLFLPTGKVEELYAGLGRCNAQIYIQRSKQLSRGSSGRPLATCRITTLHILALADPSLHGTENCINHMQQLDPDSPWPEEGLEFTTLWCRWISCSWSEWRLQLRDFPQPLLCAMGLNMWGMLMGAEQVPPLRARRSTTIDQGAPWGTIKIERSMTSLKFYHDLNCEMDQYRYAFGPCWEPIIAQCNLSWEQVIRASRDPSAPMAWWDKLRLMMHGRLTLCVRRLALLLHASLDPYNTTEEMELAWTDLVLDWTNAKIVFKGDLNVYVRTASKYDDCCLLHLPNLRLMAKISWLCLADPNDHHSVIQCAPDKIPEYSINQEHDSYRAFRSQNMDVHLSFETKPANENDCPRILLFGSTLRWFESLKQILSGATRPTRRGTVFNNIRPRKPQMSRHFRNARLSLALHCFQATYWMSFGKQRGVDICGQRVTCGAQHALILTPSRDGLKRRARASWPPLYTNCELNNAEVWFSLHEDLYKELSDQRLVRYYCLSVGKVSYGREAELNAPLPPGNSIATGESPPTHRLVVHDLKGAWTKTNRDIAFALFDAYMKNKQLKKNLSTEALKIFHPDDSECSIQSGRGQQPPTPATPPTAAVQTSGGQTQALLAQLVAEAEHKSVVFSDDLSESNAQPPPHAAAVALDDSSHCSWLIALVNAQVVLRGCETKGYVVLCAARAEVRQRIKRSCSTWAGSLQSMQYYATVSARDNLHLHENIQWVSVDEIEEKGARAISALPDVPSLVGSGHSAGGVLGSTVGPSDDQANAPQLQRIVSRCTCEFYYVGYEESGGPNEANGSNAWGESDTPCDSFTLMHHDLDVCTNSLQYAMLLDVVNNLVLYVEPQRKRALERLARMRFQIQLHRVSDPRRPIQLLQNQVRGLVAKLKHLERETYLIQKAISEGNINANHESNLQELKKSVQECKEQLTRDGEELHAMVACYQESRYRAPATQAHSAAPVRANEIYFKHAQWRLTDADGQLGIADLVLSNFQYTKNTKSDDSVEHLLELGYVRMTNLLPNEAYTEVLLPTEGRSHMPIARQRVLRVFCRERPPVGGISVKEHFEINVVPITIGLTKKFFNTMLKFCFPERDPDRIEEGSIDYDDTVSTTGSLKQEKGSSKKLKSKKLGKDTNFYVKIEKDDVEKMKERAEKNKLFIYIKIPEVPVRVSYKGNKEKNLEDLRDISIIIPTLEYHNVTWTWLDLLLAMKSDSKKVIISQALRQKLQLHRNKGGSGGSATPPEEDKARMLLGDRRMGETKPQKKSAPATFKFSK